MPKYNPKKVEPKWQKFWAKRGIFEVNLKRAKRPFYNLMMFPYSSAEGLHVGNMYAFVGSDIYGRFKLMQGYDVFEPIGLDGFGIHSENYALKTGKHPVDQAKISEKNFYRQLKMIGNGFAWKEKLETYSPEYYKWTQWIFTQMFKKGLAYRKKAPVNWCPSCKTVLADEQVIAGECERCGTKVVKKELEQWFFKITDYAERLLKNLEKIDWSERVKIAQRNWIGKSEGAEIEFKIKNQELRIKVFTTRPDTIFGATYIVLAPEHILIKNLKPKIQNWNKVWEYIKKTKAKTDDERIAEGKEKTGFELKGIKVVNPANREEIPVWVADYVLSNVGTGAIMAVPAHDKRDYEFTKKYSLPVSNAPLVDKDEIVKKVGGKKTVNYRLRDWLISRQRYWGPPIPMIYCNKCGWQAVPEKDLPVKLPYIKNFRPTGTDKSPLATVEKFWKVRCPKCKSWARRETDVSDTFLDSAWYYIGYLMAFGNWKLGFGNSALAKITRQWLPVDMYIGGAEHAVLHLLYVRFLAMVFSDWGLTHFEEPFEKFRAHGLLIKDGAKMSKSRGNVVNPDEYIRLYGADALRMYLMFLGPFEQGGDFRDTGIRGITRFLEKVWNLKSKIQNQNSKIKNLKLERLLHKTIKKVTEDIENLRYNTAVSALMILVNEAAKQPNSLKIENWKLIIKLLAPFAPYITEEIWDQLGNKNSVHNQKWPKYNEGLVKEKTISLIVQINGKVRDKIEVEANVSEKQAKELAQDREKIKEWVKGKKIKKIIFVKGKLINIVI